MMIGIDYENGLYDDSIDDNDIIHVGIEQYVNSGFLLRGGVYGKDLYEKYCTVYTTGVGYKKNNYCIDVAMKQYYVNESASGKVRSFFVSGVIPF